MIAQKHIRYKWQLQQLQQTDYNIASFSLAILTSCKWGKSYQDNNNNNNNNTTYTVHSSDYNFFIFFLHSQVLFNQGFKIIITIITIIIHGTMFMVLSSWHKSFREIIHSSDNVEQHQATVETQTKPSDWSYESACRLLASTVTICWMNNYRQSYYTDMHQYC